MSDDRIKALARKTANKLNDALLDNIGDDDVYKEGPWKVRTRIITDAIRTALAETKVQIGYEQERNSNNVLAYSQQIKALEAQLAVAQEVLELTQDKQAHPDLIRSLAASALAKMVAIPNA